MSKLGLLNIVLLQWFFIRLCSVTYDDNDNEDWGLMYFVLPMTGWWSDYIHLGKPRFNHLVHYGDPGKNPKE